MRLAFWPLLLLADVSSSVMATKLQDSIVLFGDSITQESNALSLAHRMTMAYSRRLDVLNRGYGGYNTEWSLPIFDQIFLKKSDQECLPAIKLVTIWFGANDACLPTKSQHVPLPRYLENLTHFIRSILDPSSDRYVQGARVILITPGPIVPSMRLVDAKRAGMSHLPPDRDVEVTRKYKDGCREVGERLIKEEGWGGSLAVVDFWGDVVKAAGGEGDALIPYFSDGLHLTPKGYEVVFDAIMSVVRSEWSDLDPAAEGDPLRNVPAWNEIDPKDWKKTLYENGFRAPYYKDEL